MEGGRSKVNHLSTEDDSSFVFVLFVSFVFGCVFRS